VPRVHLTRDSVAAGDDSDAPHALAMSIAPPVATAGDLQTLIREIVESRYLPSVMGRATWAAFSNMPLAVISNENAEPNFFWILDSEIEQKLAWQDGDLRLHFTYLATTEPKAAFEILSRCMSAWRA
jgi:hypothetical protein